MIKVLRKRHVQIWSLLLILLPVCILLAWMAIPKQLTDVLQQPQATTALPVILSSIDKENYTVTLRTNNERSMKQLEWINKSALTYPSAIIYQLSVPAAKNINEHDLIGRIDVKGIFHFALKNDPPGKSSFILYDFIHHQVIDTLNF